MKRKDAMGRREPCLDFDEFGLPEVALEPLEILGNRSARRVQLVLQRGACKTHTNTQPSAGSGVERALQAPCSSGERHAGGSNDATTALCVRASVYTRTEFVVAEVLGQVLHLFADLLLTTKTHDRHAAYGGA
jgi:hypothetical protein